MAAVLNELERDAGFGVGVFVCVYSSEKSFSGNAKVASIAAAGDIKVDANKADK